jgi:hypothetical protein
MKKFVLALCFAASCFCFAQTSPQPAPDVVKYGEYPKEYMTIVKDWLGDQLLDPASASIEFMSEPKPADLPTKDGQHMYGYLVEFKVNSRNRFGGYTGPQKHGALIRNGEVVRGTGFGY